jgi:hypothetical protein
VERLRALTGLLRERVPFPVMGKLGRCRVRGRYRRWKTVLWLLRPGARATAT